METIGLSERMYYSTAQWNSFSATQKSEQVNLLYAAVLESFIEAQQPESLHKFELSLGNNKKL